MNHATSNSPLVSVIIPSYNCADLITETIESVQTQTCTDIEIIVVDDGSEDDTKAVVAELASTDNRIRYTHMQNSGSPTARNRGFELSRGKYVAVIDSDDLWPSDKLERQLQAIEQTTDTIVLGNVQAFTVNTDGEKQPLGGVRTLPPITDNYIDSLLKLEVQQMVNFNTLLAPREVILTDGLWDPKLVTVHDWETWVRLAHKYQFIHLDCVLQFYRKHSASTTRKNDTYKALKYQLMVINRHAPKGLLSCWRRMSYRSKRYYDAVGILFYQKQKADALRLWLKATLDSNMILTPRGVRQFLEIFVGLIRPS